MKVIHLLKTSTGAEWAYKLIEKLHSYGVDCTVVLPDKKGYQYYKYQELGVKIIIANVELPIKKPWLIYSRIKKLRDVIKQANPDLIHSHFVSVSFLMRISLRKYSSVTRIFQVPGPLHLESGPYRYIDKYLAQDNDYWIATCNWTYNKYIEMNINQNKLFKSFYGTKIEDFEVKKNYTIHDELGISRDSIIVSLIAYMYPPKKYLGQKTGLKGHEYFIEALSRLESDDRKIIGLIVGNEWGNGNQYETSLKKIVQEKNCNNIYFLGKRKDIPNIYSNTDIAVHPSLSENLGGAVESMLSGVATIATDIGGFPDIVKNDVTGLLIKTRNVDDIIIGINKYLNDKNKMDEIAFNGKKFVEKELDINKTSNEIFNIYNEILEWE